MKVINGGHTEHLKSSTIERVRFSYGEDPDMIEFWLNDACLSYLSFDEALYLKRQIESALIDAIRKGV